MFQHPHLFLSEREKSLRLEHYDAKQKTTLQQEKGKGNFWNIFGGDRNKREERKAERQEGKKEADVNADTKKEQPGKEESKSNIWKRIKEALKKKE